jgi:PAS domain S-box-containing protein
MTLKKKLQLSAILSICIAVAIGLTLYWTIKKANRESQKSILANDIVIMVAGLNVVSFEYLMHYEEEAKTHWFSKHDSLTKLLETAQSETHGSEALLTKLHNNQKKIKSIFSQVTTDHKNRKNLNRSGVPGSHNFEGKLPNQLLEMLQAMVSLASQLHERTHESLSTVQQKTALLVFGLAGILGVVVSGISYLINKSFVTSIAKLHEGIEIIGSGELGHRVGTDSKDEIGQLSRNFDKMVKNLMIVTASRDELEEEIIERKKAEEALRDSEVRFRQLVENSLVGISIIKNDRIVYQNPEHERIIGPLPTSNEILYFENIYPEDIDQVKALYRRLLSKEAQTVDTQFRLYPFLGAKMDAEGRWVQCRANLIRYDEEEAILVNMMDITRAREMEKLIGIEDKMSSLGRVAAGIAHEIRNPLTGINTYLFTLEDLCDQETLEAENLQTARQVIGQVKIASHKIETVIKRSIDFSKPSIPKFVLTDINQSVEEAIKLTSVSLKKAGIQLKKSLAQDLPLCNTDPQLMEQVVLNLITNAARAIEEMDETKVIEINTHARGTSIAIAVSDSGPGIQPGLRHKIFDPFFTTRKDGSGIGLSMVQRIVTDHSGTIDVTNSEYGGAKFRIEIPIQKRTKRA